MLYEPEIFIHLAERAGLTLERTERDTILVLGTMDTVPAGWAELITAHLERIMPLLPLHVKPEPAKPYMPKKAPYGLRFIPQQGNYDLFDGVTPFRVKTHKNQKTKHDLPMVERRKAEPVSHKETA